jgi:hypothetical protein
MCARNDYHHAHTPLLATHHVCAQVLSGGQELPFTEASGSEKFWTSFKLAFALPWRRFKKDSVLTLTVRQAAPEQARVRHRAGPLAGMPAHM